MKRLLSISLFAGITLLVSGCTSSTSNVNTPDYSNLDVKKICSVESNGIEAVIAHGKMYNEIAKKEGVEFMRLGMKASQYISGAEEAFKSGAKTVDIVDKKKKKTGEVSTEYAAWRGCSFAVSALTQKTEAQTTWKLASPSDGYKY